MREMPLAQSVIQIVEGTARQHGAARVSAITLEIGLLAGVEIDLLRSCFSAASRSSLAEGATLVIQQPGGHAWCTSCGEAVPLSSLIEPCPRCGSHQLRVIGGNELKVCEIEIH